MPTIERAANYEDLSHRAARALYDFIETTPSGVLALPTGKTPVGAYDRLIEKLEARPLDCSRVFLVDIDEVVGLPVDHPGSCAAILRRQLVDRPPFSSSARRLLDGAAADPDEEARCHEEEIRRRGGLGLAVLGIGVNGHIALNEPGTPFDSCAHVSVLAESTIRRLPTGGSSGAERPTLGLTLGIESLLAARRVLLLASGEAKAEILQTALNGVVTESVPASALQRHPDFHVIADEPALSRWRPKE